MTEMITAPLAQARANLSESWLTTLFGIALIVAGILCDANVISYYFPDAAKVWCQAVEKLAIYGGGGTAILSRGFMTKAR